MLRAAMATRRFSKTITVTYLGLGLWALLFFFVGLWDLLQMARVGAVVAILVSFVLFSLVGGIVYVMWGLHNRRRWARHVAMAFWLLCFIWSARSIVTNGLHPEPSPGPFLYSNEDQLAGARFVTLVVPYVMVVLELSAIYCLMRKASVVDQFKPPTENVLVGDRGPAI